MRRLRTRWWLALGAGLLSLLAPACSKTKERSAPKGPAARVAKGARRGARKLDAARGKSAAPEKRPAVAEARRHPFVPALDPSARRVRSAKTAGPLWLKAVLGGPTRTAIIQEGTETHFVREGEQVAGHTVLAIRDGEVVLAVGMRKRVLSLYEP